MMKVCHELRVMINPVLFICLELEGERKKRIDGLYYRVYSGFTERRKSKLEFTVKFELKTMGCETNLLTFVCAHTHTFYRK